MSGLPLDRCFFDTPFTTHWCHFCRSNFFFGATKLLCLFLYLRDDIHCSTLGASFCKTHCAILDGAVAVRANATVLILASGRGTRYQATGGHGSKLEALLHGTSVLQHTIDAVRASGLPYHVETRPHPGMGDSIAAAVCATADADGWLILPGDLPLISSRTLCKVADALKSHSIVVPVFQSKRGHPVGFADRYMLALRDLRGPAGAHRIIEANGAFSLEVEDVGCVTDIDTVDDLAAAQAILGRS